VIYKAQVLVRTPGKRWARSMQAKRTELANAIKLVKPESLDVDALLDEYLLCGRHDITLRSINGKLIDDGSGLEYEFVQYKQRKLVIAVFVGDDSEGSPVRFAELFPAMQYGEVSADDRAFLVVSPASDFTKGWALRPAGQDAHHNYGFRASASYVQQLLKAVH
jgi:hypothetical protein